MFKVNVPMPSGSRLIVNIFAMPYFDDEHFEFIVFNANHTTGQNLILAIFTRKQVKSKTRIPVGKGSAAPSSVRTHVE